MTDNARAKQHYDDAVSYADLAVKSLSDGEINRSIAYTSISDSFVNLARFAADHHALIAGIPTDDTKVSQSTQSHQLPPPVW